MSLKPHINKFGGLWFCNMPGSDNLDAGIGYTPLQAYQDWLAINGDRV